MAFVVIYDACVLYPAPLRDLLVRVAQSGIVRARWSGQILDECFRSILEQRPDLGLAALVRTRDLMTQAVGDCMVSGHEGLIDGLKLPTPMTRTFSQRRFGRALRPSLRLTCETSRPRSLPPTKSKRFIPTTSFATCSIGGQPRSQRPFKSKHGRSGNPR